MLIRFNRSLAVREAYSLYDAGEYRAVIRYCTEQLLADGADPELRLLRGVAHLDCGQPNEAVADWRACCGDAHNAGVAHYYLGSFLSEQSPEHEPSAMEHFETAVRLGWVEGHIGKGSVLLSLGFQARNEHRPAVAAELFRQSVVELTTALSSPAPFSRRRAVGLRASVHYNLGDHTAFLQDRAQEKGIVVGETDREADPRATGSELYS